MRMCNWKFLWCYLGLILLNACEQPDPEYTIKVTLLPQEGGNVEPLSGTFKKNEVANIVATPVNGWRFVRWEGDATGEIAVLNLTMIKNMNLVAVFEKRSYPLNLTITGKGQVQEEVLSAKSYPYLTLVKLTAVADQGWKFTQWTGDLSGTTNPNQLSINQEKTVGVTFERQQYAVTTQAIGKGTVSVLPYVAPSYSYETNLTLRANPDKGWIFEQWTGDLTGTTNPSPLLLNGPKTVTAVFKGLPPTVKLLEIGETTPTSARVFAQVADEGASAVMERGICYANTPLPSPNERCSKAGSGPGDFEVALTNLLPTSTYYVRAYAKTEQTITFSESSTFTTTALLPTLTTTAASQVTARSARIGGAVIDSGSDVILERGVCYGTTPFPDLRTTCISVAGDVGSFMLNLENLSPGILYHVRAYAKNRYGTGFGSQQTFTTLFYEQGAGLVDIDGNRYPTVKIGTQEWMAENLRVKKFRNGDPVPYAKSSQEWHAFGEGPAYSQVFDNVQNEISYGLLYKWKVTTDPRGICPVGWRIPSDADWQILVNRLGGFLVAGGLMKTPGTTYWVAPNTSATNASGFSAVGSGNRRYASFNNFWYFRTLGEEGAWWSSTLAGEKHAWYYIITNASSVITRERELYNDYGTLANGMALRCVK